VKILLIDVDSYKLPNLALMKLSSFFKDRGHEVFLNSCSNPNLVFVSCIYPKIRNSHTRRLVSTPEKGCDSVERG